VIQKHLLVNQILEKQQLVHRLIVAPMKVVMTKMMMIKNNLQIYLFYLHSFFVMIKKKNQQNPFFCFTETDAH
jgi:hypothetical protein